MPEVVREARLAPWPFAFYRGTFATEAPEVVEGSEVPPGWEGLTFPFDAALADLREDGTPARDGVLPEIDLPRRMYAGEDTTFHRPLRVGDLVTQHATAGSVVDKQGRSGRLVFADIERSWTVDGELAIESVWHDVFLEGGGPARPQQADASDADWREELRLDVRALFRFSAITGNTHRIHYDLAWAREREGLAGLLVHGPLTRILLIDAAGRHSGGRSIARVELTASAPIIVDEQLEIVGRDEADVTLVQAIGAGTLRASATVHWV